MWCIPLPNSSSSFKASAILWDRNFDDTRRNAGYLCCYLELILLLPLWSQPLEQKTNSVINLHDT